MPQTYLRGAAVPFFAATAEQASADGVQVRSWSDAGHYLHVHHAERTARAVMETL